MTQFKNKKGEENLLKKSNEKWNTDGPNENKEVYYNLEGK
jgi:hypothetical protein